MVATFLARQNVNFDDDRGNKVEGVNFWYHLDRAYQSNWEGFQVIKKFIRPDDPILVKIRQLKPGKKINIETVTLGKTSVIVDVSEVN